MKKIFLFAFVLCLIACNKKQAIPEAMYFWKTNLSFTEDDKAFLKEHAVKKIYVRYCDVGLRDEQAVPIAPIEIDILSTRGLAIVPVIYIKNEVFEDIATAQYAPQRFWGTETLSENVAKYIEQINNYYHLTVSEVQFDCDWTLNTKEYYFNFLKHFKEKNPNLQLSATIRLHQVKYKDDTGVPPVDYGVLMYYNMDKITATGANSIYNRATAKRYISSLKSYPLQLNIALPMFSWGVHSVRGEVVNLVSGLTSAEIKTLKGVVATDIPNVYEVKTQTYYKGRLWQAGDRIKIEEVTDAERKEMQEDLLKNMKSQPKEVIWFR